MVILVRHNWVGIATNQVKPPKIVIHPFIDETDETFDFLIVDFLDVHCH